MVQSITKEITLEGHVERNPNGTDGIAFWLNLGPTSGCVPLHPKLVESDNAKLSNAPAIQALFNSRVTVTGMGYFGASPERGIRPTLIVVKTIEKNPLEVTPA